MGSEDSAATVSAGTTAPAAWQQYQLNGRLGFVGSCGRWAGAHAPVLVGIACVVLLSVDAFMRATSNSPTVRGTSETVMTLFALAAAGLVRMQYRDERRMRDLVLLAALLTLGLTQLCTYAIPAAADTPYTGSLIAAQLCGELFAAALFAAAAFAPRELRVAERWRPDKGAWLVAVCGVCVAALGLVAHQLLVAGADPAAAVRLRPLAVVLVLVTIGLFACAAVGFARHRAEKRRGYSWLLADAALLLAAGPLARIAEGLPPDRIAFTEVIRVLAFTLILVAAVREELQVWLGLVQSAAVAERRRVARDLHDGLAQDLAFIAAHGEKLAREIGTEHPIAIAARRALAVSRGAIAELSDLGAPTTSAALETIAAELRARFEIKIAIEVDLDEELDRGVREDVLRITREAIANAARHGGADTVVVCLNNADGVVALQVRDDGCGIEASTTGSLSQGFGLRTARARARARGGDLTTHQRGVGGTDLKVVLR